MSLGFKNFISGLVLIPLLLIALPFLPILGFFFLTRGLYLRLWFWFKYIKNGTRILFVYSSSLNWQTYIEENILPSIQSQTKVLNWSERKRWNNHELSLLNHFAGETEFNPSAIVFITFWKVKCIRFYQAFKDYKHGNDLTLKKAEKELYETMQAGNKLQGSA
jgi:hypothetical protein